MESDLQKPPSRPSTPPKTAWFEFLLNENLLEQHLLQPNPDPSGVELIMHFLYQAESTAVSAREISKEQGINTDPGAMTLDETAGVPSSDPGENKKVRALRLLALKVAAFLKWDLDLLEQSLPLAMVYGVLTELLKVTMATEVAESNLLQDQAWFATQLYNRWCIRSAIKGSFPSKPQRVYNVQVPGLMDPTIGIQNANETVCRLVKDQVVDAANALERSFEECRDVIMPTIHSFGVMNENKEVTHSWDKGVTVSSDEFIGQLSYDIGCYLFYREQYYRAFLRFTTAQQIVAQNKDLLYCKIDKARLEGYCAACQNLQVAPQAKESQVLKLASRFEISKNNNFENLVELLVEDNQKREVSIHYLTALEEQVLASVGKETTEGLHTQVVICNAVRQAQEHKCTNPQLVQILSTKGNKELDFLLQVSHTAMESASYSQKAGIKALLRYVYLMLPPAMNFALRVQKSEIANNLSAAETSELCCQQTERAGYETIQPSLPTSDTDNQILQLGETERRLLLTYDPNEIRSLVTELLGPLHRQQIMFLSDSWRIPREIYQCVESLRQNADQVFTHVCIAKARICMQLKLFEKARELLTSADSTIKDVSYKLSKLIRWEVLLADLLQYRQNGTFSTDTTVQDISKKAKTCITSSKLEQDIHPGHEMLGDCVAFLVTIKDWSYLASLTDSKDGYIGLSRLLSDTCKELPSVKNSRKPARELWESVVHMLMTNTQHKRSGSGVTSLVHRNAGMGILSQADFISFVRKIKEPIALTTIISCVTKLYNILKDDITCEISSDYITLWPTALSSVSTISVSGVSDTVVMLMDHALETIPDQPSWLRTRADIYLANAQYGMAMRYYLQAGAVSSQFFAQSVPRPIFDDQVFRRMIRCCSYLQCHTQVAVLCQFLEEIDYTVAFKALQERSTHDAMDTHYQYLWDITMLEYLIHIHTKRGELEKRQLAMQAIGQLELNSSNPPEILVAAAENRKAKFLRAMAKQYL